LFYFDLFLSWDLPKSAENHGCEVATTNFSRRIRIILFLVDATKLASFNNAVG